MGETTNGKLEVAVLHCGYGFKDGIDPKADCWRFVVMKAICTDFLESISMLIMEEEY